MNSLRETMQQGIEILEWSGNPSAQTEVEQILMHLLGCQKSDLYLTVGAGFKPAPTEGQPQGVAPAFKQLIRQRAKRVPLQYLLGESYFWAWQFKVSPGVFIPRPESEILIQQTVDLFKDRVGAHCNVPLH
ncbi:MAG: hypothetical protein HYS56_02350, partial [Candidatus Omnitrophica bacterium]|nr:hypothetical protein [Candidatus Omnitrophota bacterium]